MSRADYLLASGRVLDARLTHFMVLRSGVQSEHQSNAVCIEGVTSHPLVAYDAIEWSLSISEQERG